MGEQAKGNKFVMHHIFLKLIAFTEGRNFTRLFMNYNSVFNRTMTLI